MVSNCSYLTSSPRLQISPVAPCMIGPFGTPSQSYSKSKVLPQISQPETSFGKWSDGNQSTKASSGRKGPASKPLTPVSVRVKKFWDILTSIFAAGRKCIRAALVCPASSQSKGLDGEDHLFQLPCPVPTPPTCVMGASWVPFLQLRVQKWTEFSRKVLWSWLSTQVLGNAILYS